MATSTSTPAATTTNPTSDPTLSTPDPWTPDQELTLLKAIVKFKPVGLHAHFRMLSIRQFLLNSGTCTADDEHTRIPGIWSKLRSLYDLDRLDEREDAIITPSTVDEDGNGEDKGYWRDFELPTDEGRDFEKLMWERRIAPEGTPGSPDWPGGEGRTRRESTIAGTDEPRSSPVAAAAATRGRGGRRGGRVSRLKGEAAEASEGRSSRRESKAASEVGAKDDYGDEVMEDAEEEEDSEGDEEEEESSEEPEDEKRAAPAKRGRGGRRGRGRRGRRRG